MNGFSELMSKLGIFAGVVGRADWVGHFHLVKY